MGFPVASDSKEFACNEGDLGLIPGRPLGEGNGNPLQYSCLENPHGQRSLAGYSPWGPKELDTTKYRTLFSLFRCISFLNILKESIFVECSELVIYKIIGKGGSKMMVEVAQVTYLEPQKG